MPQRFQNWNGKRTADRTNSVENENGKLLQIFTNLSLGNLLERALRYTKCVPQAAPLRRRPLVVVHPAGVDEDAWVPAGDSLGFQQVGGDAFTSELRADESGLLHP